MRLAPSVTQKIAFSVLFLVTVMVILPVLFVIFIIVKNGIGAISWEFLTQMPRQGMRAGGILPAIIGTFYLVIGAILFALPLGLFAAIYLSERSEERRVGK